MNYLRGVRWGRRLRFIANSRTAVYIETALVLRTSTGQGPHGICPQGNHSFGT